MSYDAQIHRLDLSALFDLQGPEEQISQRLDTIGLTLPKHPNRGVQASDKELYWIGQTHWLLRTDITEEDRLLGRLQQNNGASDVSLVLVSDAYAFFEVSGSGAHQVLAIASPLDIALSVFPDDGVTFTEAFGLKALIIRRASGFEFGFDRCYADMIADYFDRVLAS
jgi:sarcosine oxidase subunit gamma